jgi:hypothetical protein
LSINNDVNNSNNLFRKNTFVWAEHIELSPCALQEILGREDCLRVIDSMLDSYCMDLPPIQNIEYFSNCDFNAMTDGSESSSTGELSFDQIFDSKCMVELNLQEDTNSMHDTTQISHQLVGNQNMSKPLRVAQIQSECVRGIRSSSDDWGWFTSASPGPSSFVL